MSTQNTLLRALLTAAIMLLAVQCSYAQDSDDELTLEQAVGQLESVIQDHQPGDSGRIVSEAAAQLGFVLQRDGLETAGGELAMGNAYFIGDDLGKAILHYRRGLAIDHTDETLQRNLAYARSFVEPTIPGDGEGVSVRSVLTWWQTLIDGWTLWIVVFVLCAAASVLWTIRAFDPQHRIARRVPIGIALVALIGIWLLGYSDWVTMQEPGAVVVLPGTGMYSGPGTGVYQEVYDGVLGVGTEGVVTEVRGEWTNIRLGNNQSGWVLSDSIAVI